MDNDDKIIAGENTNTALIQKAEVRLFLQDDVHAVMVQKPQTYDLEKEYEKTSKNKPYLLIWLMSACVLLVGAMTFGVTRYINYSNKQISVGIDVFDDLNLKKLLDMVTRTENALKAATAEKGKLEMENANALSQAEMDYKSSLYALDSMLLSEAEKKSRAQALLASLNKQKKETSAHYDIKISEVNAQIEELKKQLAALNDNDVQRAQEQQAAADSQRQVFEIEKQQLIAEYEAVIADLRQRLSDQQKVSFNSQKEVIDEITDKYRRQIALLDPVFSDPEAGASVARVKEAETFPSFSPDLYGENVESPDMTAAFSRASQSLEEMSHVASFAESVPFDNSMSSYIKTMHSLAISSAHSLAKTSGAEVSRLENLLANEIQNHADDNAQNADTIARLEKDKVSLAQETVRVKKEMTEQNASLVLENAKVQQQKNETDQKNQQLSEELSVSRGHEASLRSMTGYFDFMSASSGDTGYILNSLQDGKFIVYISPLYWQFAQSAKVFIYRKSDEIVGSAVIEKQGSYFYAVPASPADAEKIKPNDKILFNIQSGK